MNVKILYQKKKIMDPKTTRENIISIQGHITGLKKEIHAIKTNHLKHLHDDVMEIHRKLDDNVNKITDRLDRFSYTFIGFLIAILVALIAAILKHFL